jgi:hypothetical protein
MERILCDLAFPSPIMLQLYPFKIRQALWALAVTVVIMLGGP